MMRRGQRRLSFTHQNNIYRETERLNGIEYPDDYQNAAEKTSQVSIGTKGIYTLTFLVKWENTTKALGEGLKEIYNFLWHWGFL